MKKIFCLMAAAMAALSVHAETEVVNGITWTYTIISEGKASLGIMYSSGEWRAALPRDTGGAITIPSFLGGCQVVAIGEHAFDRYVFITSVSIPHGLTNIGADAFYGCRGLTSVTIPDSVSSIGSGAFSGCSSLMSITIPNNVSSIGGGAFSGCSSLTSITIPASVRSIGASAFSGCSSITSFNVSTNNPNYSVKNRLLLSKDFTKLIAGVNGVVTIPNSVTSIENYAFRNNSGVTSLTIPTSVTDIGNYAFEGCSGLTSISIPQSVTRIGAYAFSGCTGLTYVTIPDSVTSLGRDAFSNCTGYRLYLGMSSLTESALRQFSGALKIICPKAIRFQVAVAVGGMEKIIGYTDDGATIIKADIISAQMRETDPTVLDIIYKIECVDYNFSQVVNVRALAFEKGERGFATVIRPETFIEGTDANIGDGIAANVEHKLSWKVSSDWAIDLAKVKFEVLAMRPGDLLLPGMHFVTIPAAGGHPKTIVSVNDLSLGRVNSSFSPEYSKWWSRGNIAMDEDRLNALLWEFASQDPELTLSAGVLSSNGKELARHAAFDCTYGGVGGRLVKNTTEYLFGKMGYRLLDDANEIAWINENTRLNLQPGSVDGFRQYAVKTVEE